MKLTALIKQLQEKLKTHGDIDVSFEEHWNPFSAPSIKVRKANYGDGYPKNVQKTGRCLVIKGKK